MRTRRYEVVSADGCRVGVVAETRDDGREELVKLFNLADPVTQVRVSRPDGAAILQIVFGPGCGWPINDYDHQPPGWSAPLFGGIVGEVEISLKAPQMKLLPVQRRRPPSP